MKFGLIILIFVTLALSAGAQNNQRTTRDTMIVEAGCGQCMFGLEGKGCSLAIRMNGQAYFVDGADIDSFGDAHASDGFCAAIRKAEVQGEISKNRFQVSYFKLLPQQPLTEESK